MSKVVKVALVQQTPVYLDLQQSLEKAIELVSECAKEGAQLATFGESWLSGYPAWLDFCPNAALWNHEPTKEVFAWTFENSVTVPGKEVAQLAQVAKQNKITVVMGVNEVVKTGKGSGTIYNSLLTIDQDGQLVNHHRKLIPTYTEKMVYGTGDGNGLIAHETSVGRVGGLICWEHWMPMSRQAMHNSAEQIHVAVWPQVKPMNLVACQHYAFEGRTFVLAVGQMLLRSDIPKALNLPKDENKWLLSGGSCIINPKGELVVEQVFDREETIYAEIDLVEVIKEKMTLDVSGHYNRPDVFTFDVNRKRLN